MSLLPLAKRYLAKNGSLGFETAMIDPACLTNAGVQLFDFEDLKWSCCTRSCCEEAEACPFVDPAAEICSPREDQ